MKFGDKIDKKARCRAAPKASQYVIGDDFSNYADLSRQFGAYKLEIYKEFCIERRTHLRRDAIMIVAVARKITPEAISQMLREEFNHCL